MLISGASKQISPDPPMIVFIRLNEYRFTLATIYTRKRGKSAPQAAHQKSFLLTKICFSVLFHDSLITIYDHFDEKSPQKKELMT